MHRVWSDPEVVVPDPDPDPVPTGINQLVNGCFVGTHGAHPPAPWFADTPAGREDNGWDVSRKPSNPCVGPDGNYACRINDPTQSGLSGPEIDERIWQVVEGHGPHLVAEGQCVHHFAYYTDINIYGGDSPTGPWTLVWNPFTVADADPDGHWAMPVKHSETTIAQAYAWYKFEFRTKYPEAGAVGDGGGVKFTKAFFESY